jgi:hypothetical protein
VTNKPKSLKITVVEYDDYTAAIQLPVLPPMMHGEHDLFFKVGDKVIFGLTIYRNETGDVNVELYHPDKVKPVKSHRFTEVI